MGHDSCLCGGKMEFAGRILEIDLAQNGIRKMNAVNLPTSLRRHLCWGVIKILVISFEKTEVNLIELVIEKLLWKIVCMRGCVCAKQNAVLIFFEEGTGCPWLPPKFAKACGDIDCHIGKTIHILCDILQILREIATVQTHEPRSRMARYDFISCFNQFFVGRKVFSIKRPIRMIVQLFIALVKSVRRGEKSH